MAYLRYNILPEKITLQYFKILATPIHTLCGIATVFLFVCFLFFILFVYCFVFTIVVKKGT